MNKFLIIGVNKLSGIVKISGSKNSSLSIIIASILSKKDIILNNVPFIEDIYILIKILINLGSKIKINNYNSYYINNSNINKNYINNIFLIKKIRASILLIGAIMSRFENFQTFYPGGCEIGDRPIDLHLYNIKKFNIDINIYKNKIYLKKK